MRIKSMKHAISMILVLALLVHIIPIPALAVNNGTNVSETTSANKDSENVSAEIQTEELADDIEVPTAVGSMESSESVTILGEDISKREASVKHFRMSDGSFMAVSYGIPVHYQDKNGVWQDINNVPRKATSSDGTTTYQITNAKSATIFASSLECGNLLTVSYDGKSIEMSILDRLHETENAAETRAITMSGNAEVTPYNRNTSAKLERYDEKRTAEKTTGSPQEAIIPENLKSSVLYEDVYTGVDIRYTAWSNTIKEEIIVKSPQDNYHYDFFLNLDGLTAIVNENGSISLIDSENIEIFAIPAPYMLDAAGAFSDLVSYALTYVEEGIVLRVEADASWIESDERVFPISIDPTVNTSPLNPSKTANDDIYATYVHPAYPNGSLFTSTQLYTGFNGSYIDDPYVTYLYFNNLPAVPVGCVVFDVNLKMFMSQYSSGGCTVMPIGLYSVTDTVPEDQTVFDWFKSFTYNTKPAYAEDDVIDFVNMSTDTEQTFVYWDITELARKWYSNLNAGTDTGSRMVALAPVGSYSQTNYAWQYYLGSGDYYYPVMTVTYRNCYGLEDYYTYQTMDVGEAGTAYIADSTGQLKVVKNLVNYHSDTNPFSLNLVYNSDYFLNSSSKYLPPSKMGLNISLGSGWTLDCIQTVTTETIGNTFYLKHRDGDGTIHYYKKPYDTATSFYDEDGLGLTLTQVGTNSYRMDDRLNNYLLFRNNVLTEIADWDRNMIYINYEDKRITSITQKNKGATEITLATFEYSDDVLTSVTDAAGNVYTLEYASNKLNVIHKNAEEIAKYSYSGYQLKKMTDCESGYIMNFTYEGGMISGFNETDGTVTGNQVIVTYPNENQITYRDSGPDRVADNSDDVLYHYLYDHAGRTINAYVTGKNYNSGNKHYTYAASDQAYSDSTSTSRTTNHILRSAATGVVAQQYLQNTSFESGNWTHSGTSVSTSTPRTGSKSLKGTTTSISTVQYAQTSSEVLEAGKTYTLSAYVRTSGMEFEDDGRVYLKVTDSGTGLWEGDPVTYATSSSIDSGWVRISVTFKTKLAEAHTIAIYRENATGTFYADDFQLELGEAPSAYNMVENGTMSSSAVWTFGTNASVISTGSLQINGDPTSTSTTAYQDINVNLPGTRTYILCGWGKSYGVPDTVNTATDPANDKNKQCGLRVRLKYSDGTYEYHYVPFNTDVTVWQFVSYAIIPKCPDKTVSTIRVICAFERNANRTYFDDVALIQEVAQSMTYDENGMLEATTTTGLGVDQDTYSGARLLIQRETAGYGTYTYSYNDSANSFRVSSVTNGLTTDAYTYTTFGNLKSTTQTGSGSKKITTSSTYSNDGNLLLTSKDAAGSTVTYAYGNATSKMLGLPTSVTSPNGTVTKTTYDSDGRVTKTSIESTANVQYTYNKGYLSTIVRTDNNSNGQTYTLSYDGFGNTKLVKVGNRTLANYLYYNNNGYLKKQTDGNGDTITYTYDFLGRVKTATYSDGLVLTYNYTGEGDLYSVTAAENGTTVKYIYTYDSLDHLIGSERKDNGTAVMRTQQGYDDVNRVTSQKWQLGSTNYSESFTYNSTQDGSLNTHTTATGQTLTMGYDELRRLKSVTGGVYGKTYTYRNIDSTQTTPQVSKILYDLPTDRSYSYTYDSMGNIATYGDTDGTVTYTYDAQNQLTKAVIGSTTYAYTYDTVGNILTGNGHTYTYGDTQGWKDLLTKVDGQSITYDAVGNPLSYYNGTRWTFTWGQGKRLKTATNGTKNLSFTYDADGIRTSKTVDGVKHTYLYAGGKLLRETYGSNTLDFFYDANGTPYALKYNGTLYYYITNLQGDVMRIVDGTGTNVAKYRYDPYGNLVSSSGTMAAANPLRYRGYYFDSETGFYYLQSRYYDPKICRFINADDFASTGQGILGHNMFAYCNNNPVNFEDSTGYALFPCTVCIDDGGFGYPIYPCIAKSPGEQVYGVINGQATLPYSEFSIGLGSYGKSGCPYIAIYNALHLIHKPKTLSDISKDVLLNYGTLLFGAWGVPPWNMENYFAANGVETMGSYSYEALTAGIKEGDVIVFTVLNNKSNIFKGWHAMTALYTCGNYLIFNQYNDLPSYKAYIELNEAFSEGVWIYGFRIN